LVVEEQLILREECTYENSSSEKSQIVIGISAFFYRPEKGLKEPEGRALLARRLDVKKIKSKN
jgi:hypothetical protein